MKSNFTKYLILVLLITTNIIFSQIKLDSEFGTNGKVLTSFGSENASMSSMVIQSDGRILACGSYNDGLINKIALSRYNVDGSLDETFGINGKVLTLIGTNSENENNTVRVLNNGNILVAGTNGTSSTSYEFAIVQYDSFGNLDLSFGSNGIILSDFNNEHRLSTLEIQKDNKIVVGGSISMPLSGNNNNFAIARYNSDGLKDTDFGVNGLVSVNIGSVINELTVSDDYVRGLKIQPDGKILISGLTHINSINKGSDFALIRLDTAGNLDSSFGTNGKVITDFGESEEANVIQILSDGAIILSGIYYFNNDENEKVAIAKYSSEGILDTTYGINGKVLSDFGNPLSIIFAFSSVMQSDEKLLVSGIVINSTADFFIARYNIDGSLDTIFAEDGFKYFDYGTNEGAYASAIQSDGKLILGGTTNNDSKNEFTLLRFGLGVLSTNDFLKNNTVKVYPNPFLDYINLDINLTENEVLDADLFDENGRKVINLLNKKKILSGKNTLKLEFPETLLKGVYFLNISNGRSNSSFKIIK